MGCTEGAPKSLLMEGGGREITNSASQVCRGRCVSVGKGLDINFAGKYVIIVRHSFIFADNSHSLLMANNFRVGACLEGH